MFQQRTSFIWREGKGHRQPRVPTTRTNTPPPLSFITKKNHLVTHLPFHPNKITMYIVKRDGRQQSCQFDKIQSRISKLCYGLDQKVCLLLLSPSLSCVENCDGNNDTGTMTLNGWRGWIVAPLLLVYSHLHTCDFHFEPPLTLFLSLFLSPSHSLAILV